MQEADPIKPEAWNLQTHGSGLVEQVLEYQFLAGLTTELLRRGMRFEVLRGDFDLDGYDVVVEAGGVLRHIQLKGMKEGGKTSRVPINTRLRAKPSACIVWMNYDPATLQIVGLRWFGGSPGASLPNLGDIIARHTRSNKDRVKNKRPGIRILPARQFTTVRNMAELADRLFGAPELHALRQSMATVAAQPVGWLADVARGNYAAIPEAITWKESAELAHLIDGYTLAEQLGLHDPFDYEMKQLKSAEETGNWSGNVAELWITLFFEHRRWRMSSPHEPDGNGERLLDGLVQQLREALVRGVA